MSRDRPFPTWARGHDGDLEYHRSLLTDPHRMDAYERAIRSVVKPGDVVLDIGAGTGLLSMLAARRGAARVHAVESMPIAGLARELVAENGLDEIVTVHEEDFAQLEPIEPVDVVLSEFMGRFVVDDGMLPVVAQAGPWMKEDTPFIPRAIDMFLAPVGDIKFAAVDFFDTPIYGLSLTAARKYALNYGYHATLGPGALVAPAARYATLEPPDVFRPLDEELAFEIHQAGRLRGMAGWFVADLCDDVSLSTAPGVQTHWGQYLFPLSPLRVEPGDRLELRLALEYDPIDDTPDENYMVWRWRVTLVREEETLAELTHETDQKLGRRS